MSLIVQKFGGSSVESVARVFNVARIITNTYSEGNDVIAVVSAQGNTTDNLIDKALEINKNPSKREMDVLLSTGEQISMALLAMAIENLGFPVISLSGWQAGFYTCATHGNAKVKKIITTRIKKELNKKKIVIIAGFQGVSNLGDITTMGRGGSDTSAVAIAAIMKADSCKIYTDVEGVYTADPRIVPSAKKLDFINYDEMLELSSLGSQVLHNRSIEIAKQHNVEIEVLSSLKNAPGTIVKETSKKNANAINGLAADSNIVSISITDIPDTPGVGFKLFSLLATNGINLDTVQSSDCEKNKSKNLTFTVIKDQFESTINIIKNYIKPLKNCKLLFEENIAKLSIIGTGVNSQAEIASKMFEALSDANINIQTIFTSEIKVSVLIDSNDLTKASVAVHSKFFN